MRATLILSVLISLLPSISFAQRYDIHLLKEKRSFGENIVQGEFYKDNIFVCYIRLEMNTGTASPSSRRLLSHDLDRSAVEIKKQSGRIALTAKPRSIVFPIDTLDLSQDAVTFSSDEEFSKTGQSEGNKSIENLVPDGSQGIKCDCSFWLPEELTIVESGRIKTTDFFSPSLQPKLPFTWEAKANDSRDFEVVTGDSTMSKVEIVAQSLDTSGKAEDKDNTCTIQFGSTSSLTSTSNRRTKNEINRIHRFLNALHPDFIAKSTTWKSDLRFTAKSPMAISRVRVTLFNRLPRIEWESNGKSKWIRLISPTKHSHYADGAEMIVRWDSFNLDADDQVFVGIQHAKATDRAIIVSGPFSPFNGHEDGHNGIAKVKLDYGTLKENVPTKAFPSGILLPDESFRVILRVE